MKTKILVTALLISTISFSQDHDFRYAKSFPTDEEVRINRIQFLSNGDYVLLGTFYKTITIGDTTLIRQNGMYEQFFACFSKDHQVKWVKHLAFESHYYDFIETDNQNNIYLGCVFIFDPITLDGDTTLVPMSSSDFFIAKYNQDGQRTWLTHMRSNRSARIQGMQVDDTGNIYFAASVSGSIGFPAFYLYINDAEIYDDWGFRVYGKFDANGNLEYVRKFSFPEISGSEAHSKLHLTAENELYYFEHGRDGFVYQGDTVNIDQPFLMKIMGSGDYEWYKPMPFIYYNLRASPVSDQGGNLYFTGTANDTVVIGNDTVISNDPADGLLVYKTDPDGNPLWHLQMENEYQSTAGIIADSKDNLYLTYRYRGYTVVGDTSVNSYSTQSLVARVTADGEYDWVVTTKGNGAALYGTLALDNQNDVWLGGHFDRFIYFGDTTLYGEPDIDYGFIAKINTCARSFNLPSDTSIKLSDTIVLTAGSGFKNYAWSNGSNENSIIVPIQTYGPGDHYFWVDVGDGFCTYSDTVKVSVIDDTQINETNTQQFVVIPNPAKNSIELTSASRMPVEQVQIYSLDGRLIRKIVHPESLIDISYLAKGCYLIIANSEGNSYYSKFIKTQTP